jgi:hypothetical protein
MQGCPARA